jgi:uncharacterized protein involved in outer membrane biogenesis
MAFQTSGSVDRDVALPPLLAHRISVHAVRFVAPDVHLERLPTTEQLDLHRAGGNAVDARRRQLVLDRAPPTAGLGAWRRLALALAAQAERQRRMNRELRHIRPAIQPPLHIGCVKHGTSR